MLEFLPGFATPRAGRMLPVPPGSRIYLLCDEFAASASICRRVGAGQWRKLQHPWRCHFRAPHL